MRARRRQSKPRLARQLRLITVSSWGRDWHRGIVRCGWQTFPCAIGRRGVTHLKREGDGATPAGRYRLLFLYYRPDRLPRPKAQIPMRAMRPDDGWCEDPEHGRYNSAVQVPSAAAHDAMWREDHLYDIVGVLDWNLRPRIRGRGSAIFLHLARPGYAPTAGCIALTLRHLASLLAAAGARAEFLVAHEPRKTEAAAAASAFLVERRRSS
jgi:L,D-peptidoglycan transpeptidase YkuD (ErfK/YbiS/YcfS/YnhG family)